MIDIDAFALETFIRDSGTSFKENSQSFIFDCPKCGKKDKLYIRKRDGRFVCWVCAENDKFSGSAEWALTELTGLPVREIQARLGIGNFIPASKPLVEYTLRDFTMIEPEPDTREVVQFDTEFVDITAPKAKGGRDYLASRGIPLEVAVEYGLRFNPRNGRVIVPVIENGKLYGWQARATRPTDWTDRSTGELRKSPKILSLQTMRKGEQLMFHDRLIGSEHAIICEGPFDALKCHLCGGNVATMGKLVSDYQIELVMRSGVKKVYLALDPDAMPEIEKLAMRFSTDVELYLLLPGDGYKDLGEMMMENVLERFRSAPELRKDIIRPYLLT